MQPETQQLLDTLEVLTDELRFCVPRENNAFHYITPFRWDVEAQGEPNALNLLKFKGSDQFMKFERLVQPTDAEVAIANWQAIERRGTPIEDNDYALEVFEEVNQQEGILNQETQAKRAAAYQSLLQLLKSELQELQTYRFSRSLNFSHEQYQIYVLLGKTQDNDWICLASTVPKQTKIKDQEISRSFEREFSVSQVSGAHTSAIVSRIEEILAELPPLKTYGVYDVGYKYTYEHKLICKAAPTRELAFEKAADLVEIGRFKGFYPDEDYFREEVHYDYEYEEREMELDEFYLRYQNLNQFLTQNLTNILVYRLSFWDWDYIYILGQTQAGDWLGVETTNEFVFNP
ncbi:MULTISPECIES: nuclease A inhibitor family protein [unclassified Coleofasciculus]|uniref:nuclease A inhibitor family protein n=1 Tax=unclassified Coleofasciculus TaxID=2692782 RepID=UPI00187EADFC|nr:MULTISPECIES: nuclease A inhibitor family protein [unclassified Coleofasciculus]MBE9130204.1 hypothetical protein [Coleofasciculus sp. LEGE 07081]MBE9150400.1 hypothetical protein [Coleofasciculus sp. LEGE 07092]